MLMRILGSVAFLVISWAACGQDDEDEDEGDIEEEVEVVIIPKEELRFVESHKDGELGVDGLEGSYSLVSSNDGAHVYVSSMTDSSVSVYSRDAVTGELEFLNIYRDGVGGVDGLSGARTMVLSPDGGYLYIVSMFDDALVSFARNESSGDLSFLGVVTDGLDGVDGLDGARALAISPDGDNLYVGGYDDDALALFQRNSVTGAVSFLGRLKQGEGDVDGLSKPHFVTISPDGLNVYIALWEGGTVSCFSRNPATGLLSYRGKYVDGVDGVVLLLGPRSIAFSPDGAFVYVAAWNDDSVVVFSRNLETGELTLVNAVADEIDGVSGIGGAHSLVVTTDGKFVYVAGFSDDALTVFVRDEETGELSFDQSVVNGEDDVVGLNGALIVNASPDGEHVYLTSFNDRSLVAFKRVVIIDPPVMVVHPQSKSIPLGESANFSGSAEGVEVLYQWTADGVDIPGEVSPALSLDGVTEPQNGTIYRLVASNEGGTVVSEDAVLTVLPPITLEKPLELTALATSSTGAQLEWVDDSVDEIGFEIQRRESGTEFETITSVFANTVSYGDSGLGASTTYIYRIRATRNFEISEWSNESVVESFDNAPNPPSDLVVDKVGYGEVELSWRDLSAVENGYYIERAEGSSPVVWTTVGGTGTSVSIFVDASVNDATTYSYRVKAHNESGESEYSNRVVAITLSNPVISINPTSRDVDATASSNHSVLVESFLDWNITSDSSWIVVTSPSGGNGSGTQSISYSVSANGELRERVGYLNIGGLLHTVRQAATIPYLEVSPSNSVLEPDGGLIDVDVMSNFDSWSSSFSATWLRAKYGAIGTGNGTVTLEIDSYDGELDRTTNMIVEGRVHQVRQKGTISFLEAPSNLSVDVSGGDGPIVEWVDLSDNEEGFIIERQTEGTTSWKEVIRTDENVSIYLDTDIDLEDRYSYRVRSYDSEGESPNLESEVVEAGTVLEKPSRLFLVSNSGASVSLTWEDDSTSELGYEVQRAVDDGDFTTLTRLGENEVSFEDSSGDATEEYSYRVRAYGAYSYSDWTSGGFAEKFDGDPIAPSDLVVRLVGYSEVKVSWKDNSQVEDGYVILRRIVDELRWKLLGRTKESSSRFVDSSVIAGESYIYQIYAFNDEEAESSRIESSEVALPYSRLVNISSRAYVGVGAEVLIAGFVLDGENTATMLTRAVGPALSQFNVGSLLADPQISIRRFGDSLTEPDFAANDDWDELYTVDELKAYESSSGGFSLVESGKESVIAKDFGAGAYTSIVYGVEGVRGIALVELYSMDADNEVQPLNMSTRAYVGTGDEILIGGFVVEGETALPMLIRGIGPSMETIGLPEGFLENPILSIYRGSELIAQNDNWGSGDDEDTDVLRNAFERLGAFPLKGNSKDAALLIELEPGSYTCFVQGKLDGTGIALLELYVDR